ncbi:hypothetical protein GCM10011348_07500 [Marinobacterium nitratireducens]|uniref:Rap1a immunity protein domain-containing protein n=1 Tax=Marinobacterium nitratireducens TaxID=518897 RepID=A0A918DP20_9GAMM|nr:hypothetical protein [Marinobacterium nitratireducens]GGO77593.1 hypothetical protein GCM10011348_07500 [Marinobacterium nitratireducens]
MKRTAAVTVLALGFGLTAEAREQPFSGNDPQFLIESCREVVEIFSRRDEQNMLAAVSTSLSEAMRAGYCIGVVQQYRSEGPGCRYGYSSKDWFTAARFLAELPVNADHSVSRMLRAASCNG